MKRSEMARLASRALEYYEKAHIVLTQEEKNNIEVADFGLGMAEQVGLQLLTYINTPRVCAKEMVLFPGQTCPEHRHVETEGMPGKEETFRCRWGEVYLYVPGEKPQHPKGHVPKEREAYFNVWGEHDLLPGMQYTLKEKTLHWFQAGPEGAVISEFSTNSFDKEDIFTDPDIKRITNLD